MKKEQEERKKRIDERYQARKARYVGGYKKESLTSETSVEEEEVEGKEEVLEEVPEEEEEVPEEEEEVPEEEEAEVPAPAEAEIEPILTSIEGIGPTRAAKLADEGICTLEDLAGAIPVEVAKIGSVSISTASEWIKKAEDMSD